MVIVSLFIPLLESVESSFLISAHLCLPFVSEMPDEKGIEIKRLYNIPDRLLSGRATMTVHFIVLNCIIFYEATKGLGGKIIQLSLKDGARKVL